MSRYHVNIDGTEYQVQIAPDGRPTVEGVSGEIVVQSAVHNGYLVLINNASTHLVLSENGCEYQVLLGHNQIGVRVETEREQLLKKYSSASPTGSRRYEVRAPMPALVVKVEVAVGDVLKAGDGLLILEAMKMENEIKAHQAASVKEIHVKKGEPVEKGQLLILLE